MKPKHYRAFLAAGLGLALAATQAIAQQPGHNMPMGPRGGMMPMMGSCPMMADMMGMNCDAQMPAFSEGRIAFLKAELGITDAQKAAWDAYAAAIRSNLQSMQGMRQTMHAAYEAKTPVERLDAHLASMESRLKTLKDVKPALVALYQALGAEQQKKADELLTGMSCMM
jgi:LTXXQ motif family protein